MRRGREAGGRDGTLDWLYRCCLSGRQSPMGNCTHAQHTIQPGRSCCATHQRNTNMFFASCYLCRDRQSAALKALRKARCALSKPLRRRCGRRLQSEWPAPAAPANWETSQRHKACPSSQVLTYQAASVLNG